MSTLRVECRIVNLADPEKSAAIENLPVDASGNYTWLPGEAKKRVATDSGRM